MKSSVKIMTIVALALMTGANANAQLGGLLRAAQAAKSAVQAGKAVSEEVKAKQRAEAAAEYYKKCGVAMENNDMQFLLSSGCEAALKGTVYESGVWNHLRKEALIGDENYLENIEILVAKAESAATDTVNAFYVNAAMNAYNTMSRAQGFDLEGNMYQIEMLYAQIDALYAEVPSSFKNVEWRGNDALQDPRYLFVLHSEVPVPGKLLEIAEKAEAERVEAAARAEEQRKVAEEQRRVQAEREAKMKEELDRNSPHLHPTSGYAFDDKGNKVASFSSDGTIYIGSSQFGKMLSNGAIYDRYGKLIGKYDSNGKFWKARFQSSSMTAEYDWELVGRRDTSMGTCYDKNSCKLGQINGSIINDAGGHAITNQRSSGVEDAYLAFAYFFYKYY